MLIWTLYYRCIPLLYHNNVHHYSCVCLFRFVCRSLEDQRLLWCVFFFLSFFVIILHWFELNLIQCLMFGSRLKSIVSSELLLVSAHTENNTLVIHLCTHKMCFNRDVVLFVLHHSSKKWLRKLKQLLSRSNNLLMLICSVPTNKTTHRLFHSSVTTTFSAAPATHIYWRF